MNEDIIEKSDSYLQQRQSAMKNPYHLSKKREVEEEMKELIVPSTLYSNNRGRNHVVN